MENTLELARGPCVALVFELGSWRHQRS